MILTDDQRQVLEECNLPLLLLLEAEELNSDDELDASKDDETQLNQQSQESQETQMEQGEEGPQPSEEDIFAYELEGTEDKFLQFTLYDKLTNLSSKIRILQDNIKNDSSAEYLQMVENLKHYSQYLDVLNELIFSISTSVVYKILGQIELELIDLLQVYNASLEKNIEKENM